MADVGSHHFVKGAHREVLVPQPSDDPNDPLNWSNLWKITCIVSASVVVGTTSRNTSETCADAILDVHSRLWPTRSRTHVSGLH
jgi:hypothetical protein